MAECPKKADKEQEARRQGPFKHCWRRSKEEKLCEPAQKTKDSPVEARMRKERGQGEEKEKEEGHRQVYTLENEEEEEREVVACAWVSSGREVPPRMGREGNCESKEGLLKAK